MEFKDWFFEQFPEYYQTTDVNVDVNNEGTFKRYLRSFGLELDEQIMPYLRNFMDLIDVKDCDDIYLPMVAQILGAPPSMGSDNAVYRKVLAYAVAIYKVKGTKKAFQILLGILGLTITSIELIPKKKITYDMPNIIYDATPNPEVYDSVCENCSGYYIGYNIDGGIDEDLLDKAQSAICFLQPINAKFLGFVRTVQITDNAPFTMGDTIDTNILS